MPRDESAAFDTANAAPGCDSRDLLEITLTTGTTIYLADAPVTIGAQVYQADLRAEGEWRASEGGAVDGLEAVLQNVSGDYGYTDSSGVSPLEGAAVVYKRAVSAPGSDAWQVDVIGYGRVRGVQNIDAEEARFTVVADTDDPTCVMSGEQVVLEELTTVAAVVGSGPTPLVLTAIPEDRTGGYGRGRWFDWRHEPLLDRDYGTLLQ